MESEAGNRLPESSTLAEQVAAAIARLQVAGLSHDEAGQSAIVLARFVLGWTAADWLSQSRESAPPEFSSRFLPLIERRARREPVAYIVGEREFYGRPFIVTRDVLIPRPETELVVEEALEHLHPGTAKPQNPRTPVLLDFGTGSGCIAITLALERPAARIIAIDASVKALAVARQNARRLDADPRIEFLTEGELDSLEVHAVAEASVDVIAANPPYVATADRASLPHEVVDFEPAIALFAGADGLDVIRVLLPMAARLLTPGGWLVMEIGQGQRSDVQRLIQGTAGLAFSHVRSDFQGTARVVVARRDV